MKYIGYCLYHKKWLTKEDLKPSCKNLDKSNKHKKIRNPYSKCKYLVLVEKELKNGNK